MYERVDDINVAYDKGMLSHQDSIQQLADVTGQPYDYVYRHMLFPSAPDEMLFSLMRELKNSHKISMISNISGSDRLKEILSPTHLEVFDDIVLSGEIGIVKPDERIYRIATDNLQVEPEKCIFVDDSERNLLGAEQVGMRTVHYKNFKQFERDIHKLLD